MSGLDFLFNKKKRKSYFEDIDDQEMQEDDYKSSLNNPFQKKHSIEPTVAFHTNDEDTPYLKSNYFDRPKTSSSLHQKNPSHFKQYSREPEREFLNNTIDFQKHASSIRNLEKNSFDDEKTSYPKYGSDYQENIQPPQTTHQTPYHDGYQNPPVYSTEQQPMHPSIIHEHAHDPIDINDKIPEYRGMRQSPEFDIHQDAYFEGAANNYDSPRHIHNVHTPYHNHYDDAAYYRQKPIQHHSPQNYNQHRDKPTYYNSPPSDPYMESSRYIENPSNTHYPFRNHPTSHPSHYPESRNQNHDVYEQPYQQESFLPKQSRSNLLASDQQIHNYGEHAQPKKNINHLNSFKTQPSNNYKKTINEEQSYKSQEDRQSKTLFSKAIAKQSLWISLGFLLSSSFGAALYWYLKPSSPSGIPIIKAQKGPYKISNQQTNTIDEHKENVIYDRLIPQNKTIASEEEKIIESNEDTIDPPRFDDEDETEEPIPVGTQHHSDYTAQEALVQEEGQPSILQSQTPVATHIPVEQITENKQTIDDTVRQLEQEPVQQKEDILQPQKSKDTVPHKQAFLIQLGTLNSSKKASAEKKRLQRKHHKNFKQEIEMRQSILNSGQKVYRLLVHLKFANIKGAKDFCKSIGGACKVLQP